MRDEFPESVRRSAAERVGWRCSNPDCRALTVGPGSEDGRSVRVGEACHISAAARGGPRYDASLSEQERRGIDNAIWLCRICAKLVDADEERFKIGILAEWRMDSEALALQELGRPLSSPNADKQPLRFSLIRIDRERSAWTPARRFRQSPVHFGFHQLPKRAFEAENITARHSLDPIFDVTVANGGTRALLIHRVGILPVKMWSDLKGIPTASLVRVLACYELNVSELKQGAAQTLDLPDPVHVDPGAHFRFQLHLCGYRAALVGNESLIRLLVESDVGLHHSRLLYLGVY